MLADNPLTNKFIDEHPLEAARVLEKLPVENCIEYFQDIKPEQIGRLFHYFLPTFSVRCLQKMPEDILNIATQYAMSDVCRSLLGQETLVQQSIFDRLNAKLASQLKSRLKYPSDSVARLFTQQCPVIPSSLSVGEALKQIERTKQEGECQINVVDDEHKLLGGVNVSGLLMADKKDSIKKYISPQKRPHVLVGSRISDVENNKGWLRFRQLPVVDRNGIYLGELDFVDLKSFEQGGIGQQREEGFGALLSLAGLYWLSVSWLMGLLFDESKVNKKKSVT